MQILKHVAFIVLVPSVIVGGYYGFKYIKKKYDDKKSLTESEKLANEMRDKFKDVNTYDEFFEAVGYQPSHYMAGYELADLKKVSNIEKILTLEEIKFIYELAKLEPSKIPEDKQDEFLKLIHKVYP